MENVLQTLYGILKDEIVVSLNLAIIGIFLNVLNRTDF